MKSKKTQVMAPLLGLSDRQNSENVNEGGEGEDN